MNRGFGMITALLVLTIALCVSGTVMSRERIDYTQENERYEALEREFLARTRTILEDEGYRDSGVTITWTREGGARSYLVEIHHRGIVGLGDDELEKLTESLCGGELSGEAQELLIIYS